MKTKRIFSIILSILQALLLLGIAVLLRLERNYMGVMRYMANQNRIWNQAAWSDWVSAATAALMLCLLIWAVIMTRLTYPKNKKKALVSWTPLAVFSLSAAAFVFMYDTPAIRGYYYISGVLVAVTLLQVIKCALIKR